MVVVHLTAMHCQELPKEVLIHVAVLAVAVAKVRIIGLFVHQIRSAMCFRLPELALLPTRVIAT
jgi:hypothetical protein